MPKERWVPKHKECCSYFPWAVGASFAVAGGGLIVWITYARRAWDYTNQTIDTLQIVKPAELQLVNTGMVIGAIAFAVCMTLSLLLSMWRSRISSHVDDEGEASDSSSGYLTSNFLLNTINWLVMLFLVVLIAIFTVWGSMTFALDKGAGATYSYASSIQGLAKEGVDSAQGFLKFYDGYIGSLKSTLNIVPGGSSALSQLDSAVNQLRNQITTGACPIYCLDVSKLSFVASNSSCICDPAILQRASQSSGEAWKALIPTVIGMLVMYIGGSWITHLLVAGYVRTSTEADLCDRMPMIEPASGFGPPPGYAVSITSVGTTPRATPRAEDAFARASDVSGADDRKSQRKRDAYRQLYYVQ